MVRRAAREYVAGPTVGDALSVAQRLAEQGLRHALGYWNGGSQTPREVADELLAGVATLAPTVNGSPADGYVSIKTPAFDFDHELGAKVAKAAAVAGVLLHCDAQDAAAADQTLELIASGALPAERTGTTLPGCWARSLDDADRAVELGLARLRVVKGQFPLPGRAGTDPTLGYAGVVERLAGSANRVAVATHDPVLARHALGRLLDAGTPCELELFYGLPLAPGRAVADELGVPVRIYVPWGYPSLPYEVSTSPRSVGWLTRDVVLGSPGKV
jgi:proline dehydrogenase